MRARFFAIAPSVLAVALAMLLGFLVVALTKGFAGAAGAFASMFAGAFGEPSRWDELGMLAFLRPWGESATKATLLTLTGLSVAVAFRVGLFNIGAQGQLVVGALAAALAGAHLGLPAGLHAAVALVLAAGAGGAWALLAAWLKVRRGVHEVISTIMLNWVALRLVEGWLVPGPARAQVEGNNSINGTDQVLPGAELPNLFGEASRLNLGFLLAVGVALALLFFLQRSVRGFEWKVAGLNPHAAKAAGVPLERTVLQAMAVAGACAGLAGAVLVLGTEHRYPGTISAPWGFDGIAMALLGQGHPLGVLASAVWFGALRAGGTRLQLAGIHKSFPELIQGVALVLVAARAAWERLLARAVRRA